MSKLDFSVPQSRPDGVANITKTLWGFEFTIPTSEDCTGIIYRWHEGSPIISYWEIKQEELPAEVVDLS